MTDRQTDLQQDIVRKRGEKERERERESERPAAGHFQSLGPRGSALPPALVGLFRGVRWSLRGISKSVWRH